MTAWVTQQTDNDLVRTLGLYKFPLVTWKSRHSCATTYPLGLFPLRNYRTKNGDTPSRISFLHVPRENTRTHSFPSGMPCCWSLAKWPHRKSGHSVLDHWIQLHLTDAKTKAQPYLVTCPRPHSSLVWSQKLGLLGILQNPPKMNHRTSRTCFSLFSLRNESLADGVWPISSKSWVFLLLIYI